MSEIFTRLEESLNRRLGGRRGQFRWSVGETPQGEMQPDGSIMLAGVFLTVNGKTGAAIGFYNRLCESCGRQMMLVKKMWSEPEFDRLVGAVPDLLTLLRVRADERDEDMLILLCEGEDRQQEWARAAGFRAIETTQPADGGPRRFVFQHPSSKHHY